nr:PLP-dependent transferase [Serratia odorifera]
MAWKTLPLRMQRHCDTAQRLAEMLARHPAVAQVYYPGLDTFPQYALAQRQMARPGGMIACELKGGMAAGIAFLNALQLILRAVSLGGLRNAGAAPGEHDSLGLQRARAPTSPHQ